MKGHENSRFDEALKEKLGGYETPLSPYLWDKIEEGIDRTAPPPVPPIWKWAAVIVFGLGFGAMMFEQENYSLSEQVNADQIEVIQEKLAEESKGNIVDAHSGVAPTIETTTRAGLVEESSESLDEGNQEQLLSNVSVDAEIARDETRSLQVQTSAGATSQSPSSSVVNAPSVTSIIRGEEESKEEDNSTERLETNANNDVVQRVNTPIEEAELADSNTEDTQRLSDEAVEPTIDAENEIIDIVEIGDEENQGTESTNELGQQSENEAIDKKPTLIQESPQVYAQEDTNAVPAMATDDIDKEPKWRAELLVGPSFNYRTFKAEANPELVSHKNENDEVMFSGNLSLMLRRMITDKWSVGTGIQSFNCGEKYSYTLNSATHNFDNDYRYLSIPLEVDYRFWEKDKLSLEFGLGGQYNLLREGTSAWVDLATESPVTHNNKGDESPFSEGAIAFTSDVTVRYQLSTRLELIAQPRATYFTQSLYKEETGLDQRPYAVGVMFGVAQAF